MRLDLDKYLITASSYQYVFKSEYTKQKYGLDSRRCSRDTQNCANPNIIIMSLDARTIHIKLLNNRI